MSLHACLLFSGDWMSIIIASLVWSVYIFVINRMAVSELSKVLAVLAASPAWDIFKKIGECLISVGSESCLRLVSCLGLSHLRSNTHIDFSTSSSSGRSRGRGRRSSRRRRRSIENDGNDGDESSIEQSPLVHKRNENIVMGC